MHNYRTHTCGQLRKADAGSTVRLSGWIHNRRDLGGLLFIDLRDHYGLTQLLVPKEALFVEALSKLSKETVIRVDGKVVAREGNINTKLPTGEIEVIVSAYEVLGACEGLPFNVFPDEDIPEDLRLPYRFVDLRRSKLHANIVLRSKVISSIRRRSHQFEPRRGTRLPGAVARASREVLCAAASAAAIQAIAHGVRLRPLFSDRSVFSR